MIQLLRQRFAYLAVLGAACVALPTNAANMVVWESANSLLDTTNYNGLAANYWFANFANSTAVTGAGMDQNEVRNLPNWIHLETNPACKGFADDCSTADSTTRTGYSFTETGTGGGSSSTGGQSNFNNLTLPNGSSGISGQAIDTGSGTGTTTSFLTMRILPGAPSSFRMWVVLDNGSGTNFNSQGRLRVNLRNTTGGPAYGGDSDTAEAEALPGGLRLDNAANANARNGIADAWAFLLSDVGTDDIVTVRPTSLAGSYGAFAGIMIQAIPEPTSVVLAGLGLCGLGCARRRHR